MDAQPPDIAAFTGLRTFRSMPVKTYPGGMQARLAYAAASGGEADLVRMAA